MSFEEEIAFAEQRIIQLQHNMLHGYLYPADRMADIVRLAHWEKRLRQLMVSTSVSMSASKAVGRTPYPRRTAAIVPVLQH
jgi:hypothetical protein